MTCGGGQRGGTNRQRVRRRHRGERVGALDEVPPVASPINGRWKVRSSENRTPQKLFSLLPPPEITGTGLCPPLIVDNRFIVSSSINGCLCFYRILSALNPKQQQQQQHLQHENDQNSSSYANDNSDKNSTHNENNVSNDYVSAFSVVSLGRGEQQQATTSIIHLAAPPYGQSLVHRYSMAIELGDDTLNNDDSSKDNSKGHVVALAAEGNIHIIEFSNDKASVLLSWNTDMVAASCISVHVDKDYRWRIAIGYESGFLEDWVVSLSDSIKKVCVPIMLWRGVFNCHSPIRSVASLKIEQKQPFHQKNESKREEERRDIGERAAVLPGSTTDKNIKVSDSKQANSAPVANLSTGTDSAPAADDTVVSPEKNKSSSENQLLLSPQKEAERCQFLIVTLLPPQTATANRYTPAGMVEVIDIDSIENAWNACIKTSGDNEALPTKSSAEDIFNSVPLEEHWILPCAGMEIIDPLTLPTNDEIINNTGMMLPRRLHLIPSAGTNSICMPDSCVGSAAITLSDGTVAILSLTEIRDGVLSWGVKCDQDQLLLSYPCIGSGCLNYASAEMMQQQTDPVPHVACCLRGGTTYLIPITNNLDDRDRSSLTTDIDVTVFSLPRDVDSPTGNTQYIQGFTAGNLTVGSFGGVRYHKNDRGESQESYDIPVLVYSWAGGVIDIYACQLIQRNICSHTYGSRRLAARKSETDNLFIEQLVANGSAKLLLEFLSTIRKDSEELLHDHLWHSAWLECQNELPDSVIAKLLSSSSCFPFIRSLLLHLSTTNDKAQIHPSI